MSPLTDILTQFPRCRVTFASSPSRRKPCQGDRRWTVRHGWEVRVQAESRNPNGSFIGYQVRNGRPVLGWVREADLTATQRKDLHVWAGARDVTTPANRARRAAKQRVEGVAA